MGLHLEAIAELSQRLNEKYSIPIKSSKAFGGIAIGFIVCLFLTSFMVDFRWSLLIYLFYKLRILKDNKDVKMAELRQKRLRRLKIEKAARTRNAAQNRRASVLPIANLFKPQPKRRRGSKSSISGNSNHRKSTVMCKKNSVRPIAETEIV